MDSRSEEARAAEELLFGQLNRLEEGQTLDLDALCRAHPRLVQELRRAHRDWKWVVKLGEKSRGDPPLASDPPVASDPPRAPDRPPKVEAGTTAEEPRYTLLEEIASGGMGKVYRVFDSHLKRTLAMKVSATRHRPTGDPRTAAPGRAVYRFLEEAEIMGQLDHPGVVPVHDLGMDAEGRVYFTMDLVQGLDLEQVLDEVHAGSEEWNPTRVVGVVARVCETLGYAHQKGVIHRDIKPANIMVGRFGQTYVMDWGLARVVSEEDVEDDWALETKRFVSERQERGERAPGLDLLTRTGSIVGTPAYMSPEQARAQSRDVGRHSDVYAVGAMLYHLLGGCAPYGDVTEGASDSQVLIEALRRSPATPLAQLAPDAPGELVAITEKAMARRIDDRYGSMTELADELRAFLEDRVVRAHRTGARVVLRKWTRRNPLAAAALAVASLLLVGSVGAVVWMLPRLTQSAAAEARLARSSHSLALAQDLEDLLREADELWPAHPDRLAEMDDWIARAGALLPHLAGLRDLRDELRTRVLPRSGRVAEGTEWSLAAQDSLSRWWNRRLTTLIGDLESLQDETVGLLSTEGCCPRHGWSLPRRRAFARRLDQEMSPGGRFAIRWQVAEEGLRRAYPDLRLEPQMGLVPLGPDPTTGLWEFWHVASGTEPRRTGDGRLDSGVETGLVLVLRPGGRVSGSTPRETLEETSKELYITPFFLSRGMVRPEHRERLGGSDPTSEGAGLRRAGLVQATDLQWEHASGVDSGEPGLAERELWAARAVGY